MKKFITLVAEAEKKKDMKLIKEANAWSTVVMKKFITLVAEAEKKKDVKLIKESNVLKQSSDEKVYYPSSRSREEKGREVD